MTASCMDERSQHLSVQEAKTRIIAQITPLSGYEQVALRTALGRVLAENIISPIDVPAYTNAAMDGYALRGQDLSQTQTKYFKLIGKSLAGQPFSGEVQAGECVRIMTGAMMPRGTDTVVMQENVRVEQDKVIINTGEKPGQNVRQAGEDMRAGESVLEVGKLILPPELGLIASLGFAEVKVKRKLRVAFFSTGDELRSIGENLEKGQIYDSNRYSLFGLLSRLGVEFLDMGVIPDIPEKIEQAFNQAADNAEVVITSGGVSVGEADFVKATLEKLGKVDFWKVAMKPGHPLAFGFLKQSLFFGLPGNPVSLLATYYQLVQPALHHAMGIQKQATLGGIWQARCSTPLKKKKGRQEFQRGLLTQNEEGEWWVKTTGSQGSHILRSMTEANCFIILSAEQTTINEGEWINVQPFAGLM